jgi:hypothetical protein
VDNGTSFFTQHLVDGLLTATDSDEDGYVSFSDVYAYVDHRLREAGKQIPARRVDGDGDLRLAKRPPPAAAPITPAPTTQAAAEPGPAAGVDGRDSGGQTAAPTPAARGPRPAAAVADTSPPAGSSSTGGRGFRWTRRRVLAVVVVVVAAGAAGAAALLIPGAVGDRSTPGGGTYTATGPWRLRIDGTAYGSGCTVTLTNETSGEPVTLPDNLYSVARFQVVGTGTFRWRSNDDRCLVTPFAGSGTATLPLLQEANGDTDAIKAPAGKLAVHVVDNRGGGCRIQLSDVTNGEALDVVQWEPGDRDFTLDPADRASVYVSDDNCAIRISPQS